jgi:hypothetical protein
MAVLERCRRDAVVMQVPDLVVWYHIGGAHGPPTAMRQPDAVSVELWQR